MSAKPERMTIAVVLVLSMAAGSLVALGFGLQGMVLSVIAILTVTGQRRLLLALTVIAVVLGSGVSPLLKESAFYARFLLYAALIAVNILAAKSRSFRSLGVLTSLLGLLITLQLASAVWSVAPSLTLQRAAGFSLLIGAVATTGLFHWKTIANLRSDVSVVCCVLAGALLTSFALYFFDRDITHITVNGVSRFRGIFENPNEGGIAVAIFSPLVTGLASMNHGIRRLAWRGSALLGFLYLALGQSRGAIIATATGLLVMAALRTKTARAKQIRVGAVAGGLLIVVLLFGGSALLGGAADRFEAEGISSGRIEAWSVALDIWSERPLLGWGFGAIEHVFPARISHLVATNVFVGINPHNDFLVVLEEVGPVGVVLITGILLVAMHRSMMMPRDETRAALSAAFAACVVISIVEAGITSAGSVFGFLFWFVVIAVTGSSILAKPGTE